MGRGVPPRALLGTGIPPSVANATRRIRRLVPGSAPDQPGLAPTGTGFAGWDP